ncbi:C-terminal binding protein [Variovorax sp. J22R133]|uniref:C-terminal binding protein n=1 Tax=Variovorax brevis TaxID=3053503 RepID=UPI0025754F14|nr:C-terminal binding protein [Variovorax sp. J22R133]MDM0116182.1 C-terminal binding protein [Variovorax sp. J22R133]
MGEKKSGTARSRRIVGVIEPGFANYSIERKTLALVGADVISVQWHGDWSSLLRQLAHLDVAMVRDVRLDAEAIAAMKPGAGIVRYGGRVDMIDLAAARDRGIRVANVPNYGGEIEVSDHAAALTLALLRRVVSRHEKVKSGKWRVGQAEPMFRIAGATLGLVGFGKIARAYLAKMRAFGIGDVLVHDPFVTDASLAEQGAVRASVDEICQRAQIVSLHAPLTHQNRHLVNARTLALMSPRTVIVNTSRGGLVDEIALATALREGRIFGAALDVQQTEPMPTDSPLHDVPHLILSDHTAWYSEAVVLSLQQGAAQAALEMLKGDELTNWVNP